MAAHHCGFDGGCSAGDDPGAGMRKCGQGFGNDVNRSWPTSLFSRSGRGWSDRKQEFVGAAELRAVQEWPGIHADFFLAAARHEGDPVLFRIKLILRGIVEAFDGRAWQIGQGMADEGRIDAAFAKEMLFEGKDHERFGDVFAEQADPSLAPRPELRGDVIDRGDAALFHLAGDPPVEGGSIDDDGEIGFALAGLGDQSAEESPDSGEVGEDFGDANDGEVFHVDDRIASGGAHFVSAGAEEFERWIQAAQSFDELRPVHFTRGFTGGDENSHQGIVMAREDVTTG